MHSREPGQDRPEVPTHGEMPRRFPELIHALTRGAFFSITVTMNIFYGLSALFLASCSVPGGVVSSPPATTDQRFDASTVHHLSRRIWQNECAGSMKGLVSWNAGENFPSLGIGHFIWFPKGVSAPFEESFPAFVAFAKAEGIAVPSCFEGTPPWSSRAQYLKAADSPQTEAMRTWLAGHVDVQTRFIIRRSSLALQRMMDVSKTPERVLCHHRALSATPCGMYALIDYVNFKGEGINPGERYCGRGWGLLQVLETMGDANGIAACHSFAQASAAVLTERVRNSAPERGERRWLAGWLNRCRTYAGS